MSYPYTIRSNDEAFSEASAIEFAQFGSGPNAFIGIDLFGGLVDPHDEAHSIINVDKAEFIEKVSNFLNDILENA